MDIPYLKHEKYVSFSNCSNIGMLW